MGKVRRYKKKLAKANADPSDGGEQGAAQQSQQTDYLELAEELLSLKKNDDDKVSVCSVMKSVKSSGGGESFKLKKDAKRYLKHAFLLKRIEKTQKNLNKQKKKSDRDDGNDSSYDDNEVAMSNQKVLNWPSGNSNETRNVRPKKHQKGFQKKQNALLAKDLVSFSKIIKRQSKNPAQNVVL